MRAKKLSTKKNSGPAYDIDQALPLAIAQAAIKIKEENKRWDMPLIVWKNGKIVRIPTN